MKILWKTDGAEGRCTAEDFKLAFEETYKEALNAEDVNSVEKDILYNYDMAAIWQDGYLEIVTYTEHAYYSFQIFTEDQACMDNLYRSIKNAIIDTWEECVIVD